MAREHRQLPLRDHFATEEGLALGAGSPPTLTPTAADLLVRGDLNSCGTDAGERPIGRADGWDLFWAGGGDDQIHVDGPVADPYAYALIEDGVNSQVYSLVENNVDGGAGCDVAVAANGQRRPTLGVAAGWMVAVATAAERFCSEGTRQRSCSRSSLLQVGKGARHGE